MSKYLVFSHGFGVKKDDRGLLTDIAENFPKYESVLFDYNDVDEEHNVLTVAPLRRQADMLLDEIDIVRQSDPDAEISLVCHSQGCVVASIANPSDIKQAIFLAPPGNVSAESIQEFFGKRPGTVVEDDGTMRVPRADGSTTRIPQQFIDDIKSVDVTELYPSFARQTKLTIIVANQDEVLKPVDFSYLAEDVRLLNVDGDHNFTGDDRIGLINQLEELL